MVDGGSTHQIWVSETASPGQDQDVRPQSGAGTGEDRRKWGVRRHSAILDIEKED